ncbi:MAG: Cna B-type domain-containing protein, partial [Clostridia bacterium]|nr:Cna B-type domain-containing protein [Clostridia bacterium]
TINETQRTYIDRFDVTNTLPTKDITVNKVWDDLSNTYGLRPDSIKFDISRTTKTGNTTDSDWEKVTEYTLNDKNSDTWTDTVTKLLQYSETNEPFRFKFDEHTVHAYDNVLTGNDINHEADNNNVVNFKNKLKTGSVKVNKIWNDNGYSQPDHYKLKITLSDDNDILNTGHQIFTEYIETAAGSTTGTVTFLDLPIEDTNGDSIQYTVSEATESGTPAYYYHYDAQYSSTTVVPTPTGEPSEVTITNTMPLRDITITKNWQDDSNKFDLRPESVNFNVYRRTKTTEEWTLVSPSCYRSVSSGTDSDSWTINITKLLKYSRENELYSYKIEEDNSGYCSYIIPEAQEVSFSENSDAASVTFTNRLEYQYIKVTKIWNDNGVAGANNLHYDLDITLTSVTPVFKMKNSSNTYSDYTDTQIISASDNTPVIFGKLPVRAADGTLFRFSVTESVHTGGVSITPPTRDTSGLFDFVQQSNQYGYTATFAVSNSNETHEGDGYPVIPVTVTNILPFTSVEVTKTWYDTINGTVNKYDLRPTSIALQLQRNSDISNSNGWSNIGGLVTLNTDEKGANVDEWKYTFNKLLRYDESNREYTFKVNESFPQNDGGAYTVNTDAVTTANTDSKTLAISNTLKKRDVTVNKVWVDNDCTDSDLAHYDIDVHLTPNESEGISDIQKLVFEIDENDQQYKIESDKDSVTIKDVPICDKNGDLITFVPDERPSDENDQHNWGDTYYRYVKTISSAPENTNSDVSVSNPIVSYTITNTLPVTTVTVTKKWEISDFHKYGKQNITVDVYRRINNSTESKIEENNVIYFSTVNNNDKNADYIDSYSTNKKHLQYDRNNNKYIYRAEEVGKYAGFTPEYSTPETTTTPDNITLGIINKQIRGEVEFTKIDGTYERLYKNDNYNYQDNDDIVLPDVEFELYKKSTDTRIYVTEKTEGTAGEYVFAEDQTDSQGNITALVTDSNGKIKISDLPLNEYYLKEKTAAQGFILRIPEYDDQTLVTNDFTFNVDVDSNNSNTYSYTDLFDGTVTTDGKIRNEETPRTITLEKRDASDDSVIRNNTASYKLLKLIPFEVHHEPGENKTTHNTNAYNAIADYTGDALQDETINKYWDTFGYYQTNSDGQILINTSENLPFGQYCFFEIQAPKGYLINYDKYYSSDSPIQYFEVNNEIDNITIVHKDSRKPAYVKVFKGDEFSNGINGAEFTLYKKSGNTADIEHDTLLAVITTGDDGMNLTVTNTVEGRSSVRESDMAVRLTEWGNYYFKETKPPLGYDPNPDLYEFEVNASVVDEIVHIVSAKDVRIKGRIVLTKVAGEKSGNIQTGQPLAGAQFKLYKNGSESPLKLMLKAPDDEHTHSYYVPDNENGTETLTVIDSGADIGKLYIEGLDWAQYYLKETKAPDDFKIGEDIHFSVGRNNCTTEQRLTCKNMAEKAKIKITKKLPLSDYRENWGIPTFIFKIKQKDGRQKEMTVMLKVNDDKIENALDSPDYNNLLPTYCYEATTDIEVEPGTYQVTEIKVARYSVQSCYAVKNNNTDEPIPGADGVVDNVALTEGERADFTFINQLEYLDKFSHSDSKENTFDGDKALKVSYPYVVKIPINEPADNNELYYTDLDKSDLEASLIKSSGIQKELTDNEKKSLIISRSDLEGMDQRFTVKPNENSDTFEVVCNPIICAGYIYKLKAEYTVNGQIYAATFDLTFEERDVVVKKTKTVVFEADSERKSYFIDTATAETDSNKTGSNRTDTYALQFVLVPDTGDKWKIKSITHNGRPVTDDFMQDVNNSFAVNEIFNADLEFDKWKYGNTEKAYTADQIRTLVIQQVNDENDITIEALLKPKTNN